MYYAYALKSLKNGDIYIGSTGDLRARVKSHNSGKVRSTKAYKPWKLIYYEAYRAKADVTKRERELKMHAAKNELLKRLKNSLK